MTTGEESTLTRLTQAALEEFAQRGFANTTLRRIGARARMNPFVVEHLCVDKDQLATRVVEQLHTAFAEVTACDLAAIHTAEEWQTAVREFVTRFTHLACSDKSPYCHLSALMRFESINAKQKTHTLDEQVLQELQDHLERLLSISTANTDPVTLRMSALDIWLSLSHVCLVDPTARKAVLPRGVRASNLVDVISSYYCTRIFNSFTYVPGAVPQKRRATPRVRRTENTPIVTEPDLELPKDSFSPLSDEQLRMLWETTLVQRALGGDTLKDSKIIEAIAGCLSDCLGCAISLRQLATAIVPICGRRIAPATVTEYLEALCTSEIVRKVSSYDLFTQKVRQSGYVYYFVSPLLRAARFGTPQYPLYRHLALKNEVYTELCRRGGVVYVGTYDCREIDFVVRSASDLTVYMVASDFEFSATRAIEILTSLPEDTASRRVLLGFDKPQNIPDGIEFAYLGDFLQG